jgi:MFS superfamily sulfate permease-like transporter
MTKEGATENRSVGGSIPPLGTTISKTYRSAKETVASSVSGTVATFVRGLPPQGTVSHAHVADVVGLRSPRATVLPGVVTGMGAAPGGRS